MELSQKLKELRKKQGLTQSKLAEKLFVSRQAITGWEAGTSRPSTENLQSLSKLYNIPLEILLNDAAEAEPELEKIRAADQMEKEKIETEQGKARNGNKPLVLVICIVVIIIVGILFYGMSVKERTQDLDFDEMGSENWETTESEGFSVSW